MFMAFFPTWQFLQGIFHMYFLPPRHLPFNYEKVKVCPTPCHGKVNNSELDQKSMINLAQFEATTWAKHNTQCNGAKS